MNVNDINAYLYNSALSVQSSSNASAISSKESKETTTEAIASFSKSLDEEVSKISQITELASVLDNTVLGNIVKNSSEADLQTLSEDLLGSSGGREVLARLMDGQFNSIVLTDSEDSDDNALDGAMDTFSETVADTQTLLDNLENVMAHMASSDAETE